VPAFEIVLIRVDLFTLDSLSYLVHILHLSPDLDLPILFDFSHCVSPNVGKFPKLYQLFFTLTTRPRLPVTSKFLLFIYCVFDNSKVSNTLSIST